MNTFDIIIENPEQGITNYEPIMAQAQEIAAVYGGLIVEPDAIKDAKSDCAMLRKMAKTASDMRIRITKEHAAKIAKTVEQLANIADTLNAAAAKIDGQVKAYDEQRKAARREEIKSIYAEEIGEFADMLPLRLLSRPQWENKSTTDKAIRDDISTAVINARQAVETIKGFGSKHEAAILAAYFENRNMMDALATKKRLEDMDAAMEKRAAEEAERKAAAEAEEKAKAEAWRQNAPVFVGPSAEPITISAVELPEQPNMDGIKVEDCEIIDETGEVFDMTFTVQNALQSQIEALVEFLEASGYTYTLEL
jgi:hypothetical protein